jgi:hypothetical protein
MIKGKRKYTDEFLKFFGYKRVILYVKNEEEKVDAEK